MAIQTYLVPFRANVLGQAIRQELRRQGQVFVVHNKIETLPAMVRAVNEMAPDARVVMAHGQMGERQLEAVMLKFVEHEADVLVTTTIIENGLDIPRANTIIVNRADRFGLATLYQLRGRVGRSHEHAYAYFIVPGRQSLSGEARKRLKALQEFSELGAGFRLAAADLEIRGAGELLGSRQHGHIAALGFDLYCQMLERAVSELQGEPVETRRPVSLHLGVDIKIPEGFLPESADRLVVYKRLAQAGATEDVDRLEAEIEDRYGHLPQAARNLFEMGRLRLLAEGAGLQSIDWVEGKLQFRFHGQPRVDPQRMLALIEAERGSLTPSGQLSLPAPPRGGDRVGAVRDLLRRMLGTEAEVSS
jgi:transcription-repair coupling factor (superfamily II helicase)